jgi:hypothetical protein
LPHHPPGDFSLYSNPSPKESLVQLQAVIRSEPNRDHVVSFGGPAIVISPEKHAEFLAFLDQMIAES